MNKATSFSSSLLLTQVATINRATEARAQVASCLDIHDDRGDVTPRTVGIAVMTAVAVAVGAAITAKITDKENSIKLD